MRVHNFVNFQFAVYLIHDGNASLLQQRSVNRTLIVGNTIDIANISSYDLPSIVKLQDSLANLPVLVEVYVHTLTTDPEKVKWFFLRYCLFHFS